jgi:prepilin-type N-terminal cleavage/methylation domain-containing protein
VRHRSAERGFTLVELVVALTAGLVVSAAAFVLARNSMKSYQDESRIASAQVSASVGFNRLTADLQRAGYMSSPNTAVDPNLCGTLPGGVPHFLPVRVVPSGSNLMTTMSDLDYGGANPDLRDPDMVVVTGNMTSTEQFEFRAVNGTTMYLAIDRGPMLRLVEEVGLNEGAIQEVFAPANGNPRFARVIDQTGKHSYIRVTAAAATINSGVLESVNLTIAGAGGGALPSGTECGFTNRGVGLINPVSIVRYRVGQAGANYAIATAPAGQVAVTGEDLRTELLREEISPTQAGNLNTFTLTYDPLAPSGLSSQEVVAEFAVALELSIYSSSAGVLSFTDFGASAATINAIAPQNYRALGVRLATRARVPDRDAPGPSGVVTRFFLPTVTARQAYARMRTLQGQVQLQNLSGVNL